MEKIFKIITLPKIFDPRGSLTVVEQMIHIPFEIKRANWLYGFSSNKQISLDTQENEYKLLVPLNGSFFASIKKGASEKMVLLNHPFQGLLLYPTTHCELKNFSYGAVCLSLSSACSNLT